MSIIITTPLAANVAAFSPVILEGLASRTPFASGSRITRAVTNFVVDGTYLRLTTTGVIAGWEANDTILVSGAIGEYAQYNGLHQVSSVGSNHIITTTTYVTVSSSATTANVYKQNDSLYIKLDVVDADTSDVLETLYTPVLTDGTWSIDLSRSLQSTFGSIFSQTLGDVETLELFSKTYEVELYESWQSATYTTLQEQDASETQFTISHRTTVYDAAYVSGTSMLNGNFFAKTHALVHFQTDLASGCYITTITYTGGVVGISTIHLIASTYTNGHVAVVVAVPPSCDYITVSIGEDTGTQIDPIKDLFYIFNVKSCNATVLYYLNRLGGYEGYGFTSYTDSQQVERVDKYKALTWKERTLIGRDYPNALYQDVRDLITSPEVYDESGVLVEVLNDGLQYRAEQVIPQVVVKYKETHIQ